MAIPSTNTMWWFTKENQRAFRVYYIGQNNSKYFVTLQDFINILGDFYTSTRTLVLSEDKSLEKLTARFNKLINKQTSNIESQCKNPMALNLYQARQKFLTASTVTVHLLIEQICPLCKILFKTIQGKLSHVSKHNMRNEDLTLGKVKLLQASTNCLVKDDYMAIEQFKFASNELIHKKVSEI